jgi:NTE family protein
LSYVLFEEPFCRALIEQGYEDTMPRKSQILQFIGAETKAQADAGIIP